MDAKQLELLSSSSTLGKKESKRERLRRIWRHHKAGLELTEEERDLLLTKVEVDEEEDGCMDVGGVKAVIKKIAGAKSKKKKSSLIITTKQISNNEGDVEASSSEESESENDDMSEESDTSEASEDDGSASSDNSDDDDVSEEEVPKKQEETAQTTEETKPALSFAEQMMSGLAALKTQSKDQKLELDRIEKEKQEAEERRQQEQKVEAKPYIATSNARLLETAAYTALKQGIAHSARRPPTHIINGGLVVAAM